MIAKIFEYVEYSWYMDYLKIEDHANNLYYYFEGDDWFSTNSRDKRTQRTLPRKATRALASSSDYSSSDSSTTLLDSGGDEDQAGASFKTG